MAVTVEKSMEHFSKYKYWAYISYSHKDKAWADWLHNALETFRVPPRLVGRESRDGKVPEQLFPIFRDQEELPTSSNLGEAIKIALQQSRYLIVICSPNATASKWVNEEIKTFKMLGRENRILCFIVDGEPNATFKTPHDKMRECFPETIRFRVHADGKLTQTLTEPIAADARPHQDGRTDAKLKVLAGLLGVGLDELRQREKQRRSEKRTKLAAITVIATALVLASYFFAVDAELKLPWHEPLIDFIDRHELSVLRPLPSETEILQAAAAQRRILFDALKQAQTNDGRIYASFVDSLKKTYGVEAWSSSQALSAIFSAPDLKASELEAFVRGLESTFIFDQPIERGGIKYGWIPHPGYDYTEAEPAFWTATALAIALGRPGFLTGERRERVEAYFRYTQEILQSHRPLENGGWNMFARQKHPSEANLYSTALALLTLLETHAASLKWEGSYERRDALLLSTAGWLVAQFDSSNHPPGWRRSGDTQVFGGLNLQIFSELLRAEAQTSFRVPAGIFKIITSNLKALIDRKIESSREADEYAADIITYDDRAVIAKETVGFLWHPWAIECATRWLQQADKHNASDLDKIRVRRVLGHLIIDLGPEATSVAIADWIFKASETLYCLTHVTLR